MGNAEIKPTNNSFAEEARNLCSYALVVVRYPNLRGVRMLQCTESIHDKHIVGLSCRHKMLKICREYDDIDCVFEPSWQTNHHPECPLTNPENIPETVSTEKIKFWEDRARKMLLLGERFREDNKGK